MTGVNDNRTPKARLLGAELRAMREKASLTVRDLGKKLDVAPATVSRYERGERTPTSEYVARVLGTLGVTGARYEEIIEFANTASEPNFIADGSKGLHRHLIELSEFDRAAKRIVHVAPLLIPGLMQTRDYAREVMSTHPRDERDVRVELRMARREALSPTRRIEAFIAERALRDALGGFRVMVEQLRHLTEVAAKPNVSLRVLPSDLNRWTLAHDGAFVLYEFPKASPIVHLEHYRGPAFLYDVRDVNSYVRAAATLDEVALDHDESVDLIAVVRGEMERSIRV